MSIWKGWVPQPDPGLTIYGYSPHHQPGGLLAGAVPQLLGRMSLQPQVGFLMQPQLYGKT